MLHKACGHSEPASVVHSRAAPFACLSAPTLNTRWIKQLIQVILLSSERERPMPRVSEET